MYCMYHSLISIHKRAANAQFSWINLFSSDKGPELLDDSDERGVIEDVLQMAVRKQLFSLFPIINSEEEHVEAALPFKDEDLTAEVSRIDLSSLSLIKAYGDMFNASKILQALQGRDSMKGLILKTSGGNFKIISCKQCAKLDEKCCGHHLNKSSKHW